jgi:aspartyl protease family protein
MDGDQIARLAYLGLLLAALAGWFFFQLRTNMSRSLQQIAVWGLIFIGVTAGIGLWQDIRRDVLPRQDVLADGRIEIPMSGDGHYYLTAEVNGTPVTFVVDTGATEIVLSSDDARAVGLDPEGLSFIGSAQTANGTVPIAPVRLQRLTLGPITDENVRATVNGGEMDGSLLGMSYLNRFARIEIVDGVLILSR